MYFLSFFCMCINCVYLYLWPCLYSIVLSFNVPHIPCQMWFERINELWTLIGCTRVSSNPDSDGNWSSKDNGCDMVKRISLFVYNQIVWHFHVFLYTSYLCSKLNLLIASINETLDTHWSAVRRVSSNPDSDGNWSSKESCKTIYTN